MLNESHLKTWVSDKLISLMGYSQPAVVNFVIALSKASSSPADVVGKLVEYGFSSSMETRTFAEEIFVRVPHKASGLSNYQKEEKAAAMLARKQKSYTLLDADDEDDDHDGRVSPIVVASKKSDSHRKRFRKKNEKDDSEDEEVIMQGEQERQVRRRTSEGDHEDDLAVSCVFG